MFSEYGIGPTELFVLLNKGGTTEIPSSLVRLCCEGEGVFVFRKANTATEAGEKAEVLISFSSVSLAHSPSAVRF